MVRTNIVRCLELFYFLFLSFLIHTFDISMELLECRKLIRRDENHLFSSRKTLFDILLRRKEFEARNLSWNNGLETREMRTSKERESCRRFRLLLFSILFLRFRKPSQLFFTFESSTFSFFFFYFRASWSFLVGTLPFHLYHTIFWSLCAAEEKYSKFSPEYTHRENIYIFGKHIYVRYITKCIKYIFSKSCIFKIYFTYTLYILGWGKSNFGFFHVFQSEFIHINFKH